jgi:organic radical activating enzyme
MLVKSIKDEDFTNYKKASMFIATSKCNWKCCIEQGLDISICQNSDTAKQKNIDISVDETFHRYINNPITQAIVLGGLEPFLQFDDILELVDYFRENKCTDDIVIYTGYCKEEINNQINMLSKYINVIIKYGRYIPNQNSHYDDILGVNLASDNQYAERIS